MQIAYAVIAFTALTVLLLLARSRLRKSSRPKKHLRIDLLAEKSQEAPQAAAEASSSSPS